MRNDDCHLSSFISQKAITKTNVHWHIQSSNDEWAFQIDWKKKVSFDLHPNLSVSNGNVFLSLSLSTLSLFMTCVFGIMKFDSWLNFFLSSLSHLSGSDRKAYVICTNVRKTKYSNKMFIHESLKPNDFFSNNFSLGEQNL